MRKSLDPDYRKDPNFNSNIWVGLLIILLILLIGYMVEEAIQQLPTNYDFTKPE